MAGGGGVLGCRFSFLLRMKGKERGEGRGRERRVEIHFFGGVM